MYNLGCRFWGILCAMYGNPGETKGMLTCDWNTVFQTDFLHRFQQNSLTILLHFKFRILGMEQFTGHEQTVFKTF